MTGCGGASLYLSHLRSSIDLRNFDDSICVAHSSFSRSLICQACTACCTLEAAATTTSLAEAPLTDTIVQVNLFGI
ncbi:hypothetical protein L3X38_020708 [Prunus dulcis]|uniref:Uncharacterized protein n=1 Tax=Prunus dulcis TaxID=3755 RepID=A0AAD4WF00_PRUDU|nr:hypothetical protein L3X38_020708 [Prunus dulcis]